MSLVSIFKIKQDSETLWKISSGFNKKNCRYI